MDAVDPAAVLREGILRELVDLSRELGREERGLVIVGEGNTSAACGDGTFWVKASGERLGDIEASGFCRVDLAAVTALLERDDLGDAEVMEGLRRAVVGAGGAVGAGSAQPSVETFTHAVCLGEGGARWVAHTHPVAVCSILCSRQGAEPFRRHIFPDAVVVCGGVPATVRFVDPGIPLARAVREELRRHREAHGEPPKTLLLAGHGVVALGQTAREALNITLMAEKWARILLGTFTFGGPRPLTPDEVARIDRRPDERYRRHRLVEG